LIASKSVGFSGAAVALLLMFSARAEAADWVVQQLHGQATVTSADKPSGPNLTEGTVLHPGDTVRTTIGSRLLIVAGADYVVLGPNTEIALPAIPDPGMAATVVARAGKIELEIEKQAQPHFSVETPYLVALVKGTHFTVDVGGSSAAVAVAEGEVEVRNRRSGKVANVKPGFQATVTAVSNEVVTGIGNLITLGIDEMRPLVRDALQNRPHIIDKAIEGLRDLMKTPLFRRR
jgi:hypothetical protein